MASSQENPEENKKPPRKYSLKDRDDILFAQQPPKEIQLECSICLQVLTDPCILDCKCGYSFCRECIEPIKNREKPCPLCAMKFSIILPNIRLDKAIRELKTNCPNETLGCLWIGELSQLSTHLNTPAQTKNRHKGCKYAIINCFLCSFECKRHKLANHESQQCPERQYTCEYCQEFTSIFKKVYTEHWPKCSEFKKCCENGASVSELASRYTVLTTEGSQLDTVTTLNNTGGDQPLKYLESTEMELFKPKLLIVCKTQDQAICHYDQTNIVLPDSSPQTVRKEIIGEHQQLAMNNFSQLNPHKTWYSPSFYSHDLGYNLCLSISNNSPYLSVSTHILRGEQDAELPWPLEGKVSIKLVGYKERSHCRVIEYTSSVEDKCTRRVKGQEERSKGLGIPNFVAHKSLVPNFLKDDSLWFDLQCTFYV